MFSKKNFIIGGFITIILLFSYILSLSDNKLHLIFCDVGQGDAIYIRMPDNSDLLIDGGPNDKVLSCLGKHMPFYDRTIDVVVLSHPQTDHLRGLLSVLDRFKVKYFISASVGNNIEVYQKLQQLLKKKDTITKAVYQGDSFKLGMIEFKVLWPEKEWLASRIDTSGESSQQQQKAILGIASDENVNDFSLYLHLRYDSFDALFTGDGDSRIQSILVNSVDLPDIEVLKHPHHGSKKGVLTEFIDKIKPELTVVSVGKNSYGHPSLEMLDLLEKKGIKVKRTDSDGDIHIKSDGRSWEVEN